MEREGVRIKSGSVIALRNRTLVASGDNEIEVALDAIKKNIDKSSELITLVTGMNVSESLANDLTERIVQEIPSIEVTTYSGGQAWYPLLIGIE